MITIVTKPYGLINFLKLIKICFTDFVTGKEYFKRFLGGHYNVTFGLITGLIKNRVLFRFNPVFPFILDTVYVLSDVEALRQYIELKALHKVKKLYAGPNLVVLPSEQKELFMRQEIDGVIVPSEWVGKSYVQNMPVLEGKIIVWPVGIDLNKVPNKKERNVTKKAILYIKTEDELLVNNVRQVLVNAGLEIAEFEYSRNFFKQYNLKDYLNKLDESDFTVYLGKSESQGLTLVESWSKNVPTFVYKVDQVRICEGTQYEQISEVSAAPYLTTNTGEFWKNSEELKHIIEKFYQQKSTYFPRKWVEENMTDEICANKLLEMTM
jgi:hypothetical protein